MTGALATSWLLFPLLLLALCLGLGLLVDRVAGGWVPGALLLPLGLAALIALAGTVTWADSLAELVTAVAVALALAGAWLGRARLRPSGVDRAAVAAGVGVLAVCAAPVVLSGEATFAGYTLLGDTSIHFILTDWVGRHGADIEPLPFSSYQSALHTYLATAYPLGAHAALAAAAPLGLEPLPWIYQPFLAVIVTMVALALYSLLGRAISSRRLRAGAAFLAAQPGLVYAYYLQGSIKELATLFIVALFAALVLEAARRPPGPRRMVPPAIALAAGLGVLNLAFAPYAGPLLLAIAAVIVLGRSSSWPRRLAEAGALGGLALLLSIPTVDSFRTFTRVASTSLTSSEEFGNLIGPLRPRQVFGIWPRGDFRLALDQNEVLVNALIALVVVAALVGAFYALRRRLAAPALFAGATAIGSLYAISRGSPWADGKALMILSPAMVLLAMLGVEYLRRGGKRLAALAVFAAIAAGILWTNGYAYRWVDLAPRERLSELADVGDRLDGEGRTLYPEFEEFAKYFMREAAPTGASESWQPPVPAQIVGGGSTGFSQSYELDQLAIDYVLRFPNIVLRRSAAGSRPPANYRLAWRGDWYEIWQRPRGNRLRVLRHLGLGEPLRGQGHAACEEVRAVARHAREDGGRLAWSEPLPVVAFVPAFRPLPPAWGVDGIDPRVVRPVGRGRIEGAIRVPRSGPHELWLEGSFGRPVAVEVDGRTVGTSDIHLNPRDGSTRVAVVDLDRGRHEVAIERPGGTLAPGSGGQNRAIGPLLVRPAGEREAELREGPPSSWRELCGRTLDWVEAVREEP